MCCCISLDYLYDPGVLSIPPHPQNRTHATVSPMVLTYVSRLEPFLHLEASMLIRGSQNHWQCVTNGRIGGAGWSTTGGDEVVLGVFSRISGFTAD